MSPHISVILPLYNGERFVEQAVMSLQHQTMTDWECLLIDDGSPNREGAEKVQALTQNDSRFRLVLNEQNQGLGAIRNLGVSLSKGEWIAFQDQDDHYFPEAFAKLLKVAEETGAEVIEGLYTSDIADFAKAYSGTVILREGKPLAEYLVELYHAGNERLWSRIYRRDWWEQNKVKLNEDRAVGGLDDVIFCMEYLWKAKVAYLEDLVYFFAPTPGSQGSLSVTWMKKMIASFRIIWANLTTGLLVHYPEMTEEARRALRIPLDHWVNKCYHHRKKISPEELHAIAQSIDETLNLTGIKLSPRTRFRLYALKHA